jgi:hypothetical protein
MEETLFEDFLNYCEQDSELVNEIKSNLADYFDLPNRTIPLTSEEKYWITNNLTQDMQRDILGYTLKEWNSKEIEK